MAQWFVLPVDMTEEGVSYPKYAKNEGVKGYSSQVVDFSDPQWNDFPIDLPFTGEQYIAHVYGDRVTLDSIGANADTHTMTSLNISKEQVAEILNQHFEQDRTFDKWAQSMGVSA